MAVHRNCKRQVDGILAANVDRMEPHHIQILIHEVEDVRAERDELYKEIGEAIHAWDELSLDEPMSQEFISAIETLRDRLPFPRRPGTYPIHPPGRSGR